MHFKTCSKCGKHFRTPMKYAKVCEECYKVNKLSIGVRKDEDSGIRKS